MSFITADSTTLMRQAPEVPATTEATATTEETEKAALAEGAASPFASNKSKRRRRRP
jgi:hypothetical protein